jgi:hypothetical protein
VFSDTPQPDEDACKQVYPRQESGNNARGPHHAKPQQESIPIPTEGQQPGIVRNNDRKDQPNDRNPPASHLQ